MTISIKLSARKMLKAMVPISRFNRGEASKIFEEVNQVGMKIVLKNNVPVGVIIDPQQYETMLEMLEDYALYFEAEKRLKNAKSDTVISHEQVLAELGIAADELDIPDADIEA